MFSLLLIIPLSEAKILIGGDAGLSAKARPGSCFYRLMGKIVVIGATNRPDAVDPAEFDGELSKEGGQDKLKEVSEQIRGLAELTEGYFSKILSLHNIFYCLSCRRCQ